MPEDFKESLKELCGLQRSCKSMIRLVKSLDKKDGGLFAINLKTGKKSEIKGEDQ